MINGLRNKFGVSSKHASVILNRLLDSAEQCGLFRVAGNRRRMVRPSLAAPQSEPADSGGNTTRFSDAGIAQRTLPHINHSVPQYHKLIEGALEELPTTGDSWREQDLKEWLDLFERVLRVVYKVQRQEPA